MRSRSRSWWIPLVPAISLPPGFLYGYTQGRTLEDCGKLGCLAAGIVIQQIGPRPMKSLAEAGKQASLT